MQSETRSERDPQEAVLSVEDLSVSLAGFELLSGVSFVVHRAEVLRIRGANGSGKTILLDVISGFVSQSAGRIKLDNRRVEHIACWRRSRLGISRSFQHPRVCSSLSVREHAVLAGTVAHGTAEASDGPLEGVKRLGLGSLLQTPAGELSYGQQKLLGLALALSRPAGLFLLDEPLAAVDAVMRLEVGRWNEEIRRSGRAVVIVEHEAESTAGSGGVVLRMERGRLSSAGGDAI